MANNILQGILQLIAILSCCYGLYSVYGLSANIIALIYNGAWFICGFLSNFCGLGSILMALVANEDEPSQSSHYLLQYHYLFSWFTVILGYPTLVTQFWLSYYPTPYSHILVALSVIPMVAWAYRNNMVIVGATQAVTVIAILAHAYICYLAKNNYGLIGAAIMVFIIISLSLPTRYSFLGISSREGFVVGLAVASYIFSIAVSQIVSTPTVVKSLNIFE